MDNTVRNINNLRKNVQLEFDFEQQQKQETQEAEAPSDPSVTRGSKRFIEQMNAELAQEKQEEQPKLFEDEE